MAISERDVLDVLKAVQDPDLHRDIVSLGFVKDLDIQGEQVAFTLELTTPACPAREQLADQARGRVLSLRGVKNVDVHVTAQVTSRPGKKSPLIPQVKNTVAVASGKGGVGKSTIAANLAVALARVGARVGLMDTDVYGPSIPILMGAEQAPTVSGNNLIPPVQFGVKLISMAFFLPKDDAVIWRGPMLHKTIQQFLGNVEWGELDYLIMDLPPGTGDIQLSLSQTIPLTGAVIVSTPQDLALTVASKAIAMFRKLKVPILGIVENMSSYVCPSCGHQEPIFGHGGAKQASENLEIPFLGEIPLDPSIRANSDAGRPLAGAEGSTYAKTFQEMAEKLAAQVSIANFNVPMPVSIQ